LRAGWTAALAIAAGLLVAAQPAAANELGEPVTVTADAPPVVAAGTSFRVQADVAADPGALDIATQPLSVRIRLAPECGGSFAGTEGPTVVDRVLPAPSPGAAYQASVGGEARVGATGPETICAFVEDADERQFATDTEAGLTVVTRGCFALKEEVASIRRRRAALRKRIAHLRHLRRHATGKKRRALTRRIRALRRKRHRLAVRKRQLVRRSVTLCGSEARISAEAGPPHINHLFVIVLENENADQTFDAKPPAPYLGKTIREAGAFIPNYYGIGHLSLDNYIAMVSGQPPNVATQADCQTYSEFAPGIIGEDGVAIGQGCVYPAAVQTVANQLENSGRSWRGYMQDMANSFGTGEPATCRHPALNAPDPTQTARPTDQYAARHNPFVYFHSIIDSPTCLRNDVDLSRLPHDLANEANTPEYSFITPDLCADGHDETCADGTSPGGFAGIEAFLREWVPRIQESPAYQDRGAILVTFDESESGAESCCGETTGPNTANNGGPTQGSGGGRVGAVMLSPCVQPGTVTSTAYNHYSFLRWTEDNWNLAHLANAGAKGLVPFGTDIFNSASCDVTTTVGDEASARRSAHTSLRVRPRRAVVGRKRVFRFRVLSDVAACEAGALIRLAGHRVRTNRNGRARLKVRFRHKGRRLAVARPQGCAPARARVRVVPPRGR
jgi:phosphatidylinositol-3-phosphatase